MAPIPSTSLLGRVYGISSSTSYRQIPHLPQPWVSFLCLAFVSLSQPSALKSLHDMTHAPTQPQMPLPLPQVNGVAGAVCQGGAAALCALTLALDVACGMCHIHAKNIIHGVSCGGGGSGVVV